MPYSKPPERFGREGVGSVFTPGTGPPGGQPEPLEIEAPEDHFARMLADLNKPAARWKTPQLQEVMQALLGNEATLVAKRVTALSKSYQEHLREHVDSWINTGKGPLGDRPASRRPSRTIHDIVTRVFETSRAVPIPVKDGYVVLPVPAGVLQLGGDNGLDAAELMLVNMLVSPWRLKIAQCVTCRKYFSLKHWERTYKDGTVCTRCIPRRKVKRSADSKKDRRIAAEQELYHEAATHFWRRIAGKPHWKHDRALKDAIAAALSAKIEVDAALRVLYPGGRLTGKWLAHKKNWKGIEEAATTIAKATS